MLKKQKSASAPTFVNFYTNSPYQCTTNSKKNSTFAPKFVLLTQLCKITPYPPYHESKKKSNNNIIIHQLKHLKNHEKD